MPRRVLPLGSHGEITYAPAARGGWRARCHFRGLDGIRVRVEKTGRTKDQARQLLLAELLDRSQALGSETLNGESTMRELAEVFFERLSLDNRLLPKTIAKYRSSIEAFVAMTESVRLREMTPALIENRLHRIPSKDKAFKTRQMLTRMFNYALLQDAVTMNPVTATSPIRRERPDVIETMTDADIDKVRAAVRQWAGAHERPGPKNHDMIDLIEVLLATGIRIGEALALRWSDLALDDPTPTLTINGQVDYEPGRGPFRKATKTKHSNRVSVLPHLRCDCTEHPQDADAISTTWSRCRSIRCRCACTSPTWLRRRHRTRHTQPQARTVTLGSRYSPDHQTPGSQHRRPVERNHSTGHLRRDRSIRAKRSPSP